jgi:hypothetical protein
MSGRKVAKATAGTSLGCKSEETESTEIQSRNATTGVIARTGTEMAEAHHDNAMHRKFVLQVSRRPNALPLRIAFKYQRSADSIWSPCL